jgi:RNA polymerase sigma factor (sigma-70 family)
MSPKPDAKAWIGSVVSRYEGPLVRYAQKITGDLERARDVVQGVFLTLCREADLAPWLFTVCRNRALDVRRKESRMSLMSDAQSAGCPSREVSPDAAIEQRETLGQVLELLSSLPENQQEVLRLKFQNGFSYREISGITQLSVTNVGYLIHMGIKSLKAKLHGPMLAPRGT